MTTPNPGMSSRRMAYEALVSLAASGQLDDVSNALGPIASQVAVDQCTACEFGEASPNRVPWNGVNSPVALVGAFPTPVEAERGIADRDVLSSIVAEAGFQQPVAYLNMLGCAPSSFGQVPMGNAYLACGTHFGRQLNDSRAWIVIEVGTHAFMEFNASRSWSLGEVGKWRWRDSRLHTNIQDVGFLVGGKARDKALSSLRAAHDASMGWGIDAPPAYLNTNVGVLRPQQDTEQFNALWSKRGYVTVYSKVLQRNVVMYDPERHTPGSAKVKLPGGFGTPVWFTPDEVARVRHPADLQRIVALKDVLPVVVVG